MEGEKKPIIKLRKYEKTDHDKVCRIYYNGLIENWIRLYGRSINFKCPVTTLAQISQMALVYQYVDSLMWVFMIQFFIQAFLMFSCFYFYWAIAW